MKTTRVKNWGFPRWGDYGQDKDTVEVQMCDYTGCSERADHPAPKAPNSPEKWWFCQPHAGEYNRNWNFFQGMSSEEAKRHMKDDAATAAGFKTSGAYEWGGAKDENGLTNRERTAYDALELEHPTNEKELKAAYRSMAKIYHPDVNGDDPIAAEKFQAVQIAYDTLKAKVASYKTKA